MSEPSWGVVATIDEPPELAVAFAAYHLGIGAAEVHVFLDNPNPAAEAALAALPGCRVTLCDTAYWQALLPSGRPKLHPRRQALNAQQVYDSTGVDWLLHADADEYVRDGAWLSACLASLPAEVNVLRLAPIERVRHAERAESGIFDGVFRAPSGHFDEWGPDVYGRFAKFLVRGVTGHFVGKSLLRTGLDVQTGVHFGRWRGTREELTPARVERRQLLHFDGLTRLHYAIKLLRRAYEPPVKNATDRHSAQRLHQIRYLRRNAGTPQRVAALVDGVQAVDEAQAGALEIMNRLERAPFDPGPALARMGVAPDLSTARFDRALMERDADLIARAGLALPLAQG